MNLLKALPGLLQTIGKVVGIDVGPLVKGLEGQNLSPEKQAELEQAVMLHEKDMRSADVEELKVFMSEALAEIQSSDKYVSRARPTGLYIFYIASFTVAIGLLLGVKVDPAAILTVLGPLAGVGGTYVYRRSTEKIANGDSK